MFRKKWFIALVVIVLLAAVGGANFYFKKRRAISVNAEAVKKRDLEAIVSASGTIQAKRFVNMSAVQMGRVTRLAVEEGDRVKAGQFLLEIDPNVAARARCERGEAAVAGARGRAGAGEGQRRDRARPTCARARPGEAAARALGAAADHARESRPGGEPS